MKKPSKLIALLLIILVFGFLLIGGLWLFSRSRPASSPISNSNLTSVDAQNIASKSGVAKAILDNLWAQRDLNGFYPLVSQCQLDQNQTLVCPSAQLADVNGTPVLTWRDGLGVIWGRFQYWQATGDQQELTRLQSDIDSLISQVLDNPDRILQTNQYNCLLMKDLALSPELSSDYQLKAARLCLESYPEGSLDFDLADSQSILDQNFSQFTAILDNQPLAPVFLISSTYNQSQIFASLINIIDLSWRLQLAKSFPLVSSDDLAWYLQQMDLSMSYLEQAYQFAPDLFEDLDYCLFRNDLINYFSSESGGSLSSETLSRLDQIFATLPVNPPLNDGQRGSAICQLSYLANHDLQATSFQQTVIDFVSNLPSSWPLMVYNQFGSTIDSISFDSYYNGLIAGLLVK